MTVKEIVGVLLLLTAVLFIYMSTVGKEGGMESQVRNGGGQVHTTIERLNP